MNENIIHFTNSFEVLKKILETLSLKLTYCQEDLYLGTNKISSAAHPMVCFSEYDINQISKETITYGRYGLAFSNRWKSDNKIHPVFYIDNNSIVADAMGVLLKARRNKEKLLSTILRSPIMTIKCFTKNVRGYNSHLNKKDFNFKSEKEWRFVPDKKSIGGHFISESRSVFLKNKRLYNDRLIPFPLKFEASSIKVIFVSTEKEKLELLNLFNINSQKILLSKWKIK